MELTEGLPRTGFWALDNATNKLRRAPRTVTGLPVLSDPTQMKPQGRAMDAGWDSAGNSHGIGSGYANSLGGYPDGYAQQGYHHRYHHMRFEELDTAYRVDSYVRQGVDKYVELVTKHGWYLDCETPEPVAYLKRRFQLMGIMTEKSVALLIDQLVLDFVKYGNAFLVKKRALLSEEVPGIPTQGVGGRKAPVLGYFRADPKRLRPVWSANNKRILSWEYTPPGGKPQPYSTGEIIHFAHTVQAGEIWGQSSLLPVLEDVRAYRQCEEYVIRLLYKGLNPLLHHEVPDLAGTGQGRQEDVDAAYAAHAAIAPDGLIITPPNHKIQVIGAESKAIRGEGYMELMRERLYAGLGVNAVAMGAGDGTSAGSADAMTVVMHNRAKLIQRTFGELLTERMLYELLLEGSFDPTEPMDHVRWVWVDIETEALLAKENHEIQKWLNNMTTLDEARRAIGLKPLPEEELLNTYVHLVTIPGIEAQGEQQLAVASARATGKPAERGGGAQSTNRAKPKNQHGTRASAKIRPTSSKY